MEFRDWLLIAVPVATALIVYFGGIIYQNRKQKRDAKLNIFLTLMAFRETTNMLYPQWVESLNKIDVVFQKNNNVRKAWKEYFLSLHKTSPTYIYRDTYKQKLLSEISKDLGYKKLNPDDLAIVYTPELFGEQFANQYKASALAVQLYEMLIQTGKNNQDQKQYNNPAEQKKDNI